MYKGLEMSGPAGNNRVSWAEGALQLWSTVLQLCPNYKLRQMEYSQWHEWGWSFWWRSYIRQVCHRSAWWAWWASCYCRKPQGKKLVSCRNRTIFSTFNSRILNQPSCLSKLVRCAKEKNIDSIAVKEHRFIHPDTNIYYQKIEDYHAVTASSWKTLATHLLEVYVSYFPQHLWKMFCIAHTEDIFQDYYCRLSRQPNHNSHFLL